MKLEQWQNEVRHLHRKDDTSSRWYLYGYAIGFRIQRDKPFPVPSDGYEYYDAWVMGKRDGEADRDQ